MDPRVKKKYEELITYLGTFDRVGVACSGGVDSTFLAHSCCRALGSDRVVVLFGDSTLQSSDLRNSIEGRLARDLGTEVQIKKILVDPFGQAAFKKNARDRCYVCKKYIFQQFLDVLAGLKVPVLFDGTNRDDLQEDRPGLKALEELEIISPLVTADFGKEDIRLAASALGLTCADLPSNSCLATRIETNTAIEEDTLRSVESLESFLHERGYHGCRVRPRSGTVFIEVLSEDIEKIVERDERGAIVSYFQENGYPSVMLDLKGRKR